MTTIHLTDAQRDTFAACGLIVIDGEELADWHGESGFEWVAPEGWRILTEPCDTCGDSGVVPGSKRSNRCPDCVGGRRVVTLTATCPQGLITADGYDHSWCGRGPAEPIPCDQGVVTLGRFTIPALLRVVDWREGAWWREAFLAISSNPLEPPHLHDGKSTVPVALDPLPRPGQFIARPERVEVSA